MANLVVADDIRRITPVTKPADIMLFAAENMKLDGSGWQVKPFTREMTTAGTIYADKTSNPKFLVGDPEVKGTATQEMTIPKDGRYHLWVRYLDVTVPTGRTPPAVSSARHAEWQASRHERF